MSDKNYSLYRQYHEEILKRQLSNNEAFDKAILSLSSAGLALTLTFFKFIVPAENAVHIDAMKLSWILFLLAIISTIISFVTSQKSLKTELKNAEEYYLNNKDEYANKNNPSANLTEFLNTVSGVFFICAIVSVVYFVIKNV